MRLRQAILALSMLALIGLTSTGPASAARQERITINPDEEVVREFGPVAGNNPANDAHNPTTCEAAPYCDTIPITVVPPPGLGEDDEFFVKLELAWDSPEIEDPSNGEIIASNDMDMFIYNDPEQPEAGPDQDGVIASGATQTQPEIARLFKPSGDFSVVIVNFVGANTGYKITATYVADSFEAPFEFFGPPPRERPAPKPSAGAGPSPSSSARPPAPSTAPSPASSTREATTTGSAPSAAPGPAPSLTPGAQGKDADLAGGIGSSGEFESSLGAPASARPIATQPVSSPSDPSTLAIVLSLVVAPVVVAGVGGAWFVRRRSA